MDRFKLAGHEEKQVFEPSFQCSLISGYTKCEMLIPGVGRLRTGGRHPNFHLTEVLQDTDVQSNVTTPTSPKKQLEALNA